MKSRIGFRIKLQNQKLLAEMNSGNLNGRKSCKRSVSEFANSGRASKASERAVTSSVMTKRSIPRSTMQDSFTPE